MSRGRLAARLGPNRPVHPLDLIFSRLDDEAQQVVGVGERTEVGEGNGLVAAGAGDEVVAGGEIPLAARDVAWGAGDDGVGGTEPVVRRCAAALERAENSAGERDQRGRPAPRSVILVSKVLGTRKARMFIEMR